MTDASVHSISASSWSTGRWSAIRLVTTLAIGLLIWAAVAGVSLGVGSTGTAWPTGEILRIRLEPVLLSSLIGAALAAAGVAYQAILRNPLADPYLLGVSSGASLSAYLWHFPAATALALTLGHAGQAASEEVFAFVGALLAIAIVLILAGRRGKLEPVTLLLVGVIVNAICGSIFLLINQLDRVHPLSGESISTFLVGGVKTILTPQEKWLAAACVGAGFVALLYLAGQLQVATLSEGESQALGVRLHRLRWIVLIIASLMTAAAVAISGPIGFVGLVCPHLARLLVGSDQRKLLPISTALGAILLLLADAASRALAAQNLLRTQLPVGVLSGLLGGPFFLVLLYKNRKTS